MESLCRRSKRFEDALARAKHPPVVGALVEPVVAAAGEGAPVFIPVDVHEFIMLQCKSLAADTGSE